MHLSISEIIAVCAIGSPVLVTFINCWFENRRNLVDHRIAAINELIKQKQDALSQFSYMYSVFLMEPTVGKSKVREDLFKATVRCLCYVDNEYRQLVDQIEIALRQGTVVEVEGKFYKVRNLLIHSIDKDYQQIQRLVVRKPIATRIKSKLHME